MTISAPTFVQPLASDHTNGGKLVVVDVTITSYTTNGEAFDIKQLGLSEVWSARLQPKSATSTLASFFLWDHALNKIWSYSSGGAQSNSLTSGLSIRGYFYGLSS